MLTTFASIACLDNNRTDQYEHLRNMDLLELFKYDDECLIRLGDGYFEELFEVYLEEDIDLPLVISNLSSNTDFLERVTSFLEKKRIDYKSSRRVQSLDLSVITINRREIIAYKQRTLVRVPEDDFKEFVLKCREEKNPENSEETIILFKASIRNYILSRSSQDYVRRFSPTEGRIISCYLEDRGIPNIVENMKDFDDVVICILHETLYEM